jgi:hypothetical protein
MRAFRDGWMKENRPGAIDDYYDVAPGIVNAVTALGEEAAREIWNHLYVMYLVPCIAAVKAEDFESAYETYQAMVDTAATIVKRGGM